MESKPVTIIQCKSLQDKDISLVLRPYLSEGNGGQPWDRGRDISDIDNPVRCNVQLLEFIPKVIISCAHRNPLAIACDFQKGRKERRKEGRKAIHSSDARLFAQNLKLAFQVLDSSKHSELSVNRMEFHVGLLQPKLDQDKAINIPDPLIRPVIYVKAALMVQINHYHLRCFRLGGVGFSSLTVLVGKQGLPKSHLLWVLQSCTD